MFARVTTIQIEVDKIDEAVKNYEELLAVGRKSVKGIQGGYLLTDRKTGKRVAITFWANEEDAIDVIQSDFVEQLRKFRKHFVGPVVSQVLYEISAQG